MLYMQNQQQPIRKRPMRPVLLQMPSSSDSCSLGYAQLAQMRLRTTTSPRQSVTPLSSPRTTAQQASISSHRHPTRTASLPPARVSGCSSAEHGISGSQHLHTNDRIDLRAGSMSLRRTSTATTMRSGAKEQSHALTAEVLDSTDPDCPRPLPETGSYFGPGRFAPQFSTPDTLGL
jgi:hypothetical protein